jgi:hypothetical protein
MSAPLWDRSLPTSPYERVNARSWPEAATGLEALEARLVRRAGDVGRSPTHALDGSATPTGAST